MNLEERGNASIFFSPKSEVIYCQLFNVKAGKYSTAKSTGTKEPGRGFTHRRGLVAEWNPERTCHKLRPVAQVSHSGDALHYPGRDLRKRRCAESPRCAKRARLH